MKMFRLFILLTAYTVISQDGFSQDTKNKKFIDPSNMDLSVKPGDNFYLYANGTWLKKNPIPPSKTRWGSFNMLTEESSQALRGLLENASKNAGSNLLMKRVGDYYASAMDSAAIEKLGAIPVQPFLRKIKGLKTKQDVLSEINFLRAHAITGPLYSIGVRQDAKHASNYIINIGQGGTSLPDRDYYLKNDPRSTNIRKEFLKYVAKLFTLTGLNQNAANNNAATVLRMETSIAKAQLSRTEMRDPVKLYNKFSVTDLNNQTTGLNWNLVLSELGFRHKQDSVVVSNPAFLRFADSMLKSIPVNDWKTYLEWDVIRDATPYLSNAFTEADFAFTSVLTGQKEQTPRWQRMSTLIDRQLGELLGQLYVDKYFKPEAKKRMLALVNNLQQTFGERIKRLDWMSEVTKLHALEKLHAYAKKIGYPDKWKNYDGLVITRNDFLGNIHRAAQWQYSDNIGRLGKAVDKTEWNMTPPTVNANYSSTRNEITFPAGILQPPFFDFDADDAVNYGGIGSVIGHEMTHGFDDQGRQFDPEGNLHDWWIKSDADEFKKRVDMVVEQYNGFSVLDTLHVNGRLTLGENLADLGGLNIAYEAFRKTEQSSANNKIDGFTPDQRFFLNWAQIWRSNILPESASQLLLTDPHSPGMYRCNGPLTNIDAFYDAFDVKEGDKMYKPVDKRIRVW